MPDEPPRAEAPQELRLEGFRLVASLLLLGATVLAAVAAAFWAGRWVERRSQASREVQSRADPLANVVGPGPAREAEQGLSYFDDPRGGAAQLEPGREAARRSAPPSAPPAPADAAPAPGPFFVQVFAGRDRDSAEQLVGRLQAAGHGVQVRSEREGSDELFKVLVGGYPSETAARQAQEALRSAGFSGAWIVRVE